MRIFLLSFLFFSFAAHAEGEFFYIGPDAGSTAVMNPSAKGAYKVMERHADGSVSAEDLHQKKSVKLSRDQMLNARFDRETLEQDGVVFRSGEPVEAFLAGSPRNQTDTLRAIFNGGQVLVDSRGNFYIVRAKDIAKEINCVPPAHLPQRQEITAICRNDVVRANLPLMGTMNGPAERIWSNGSMNVRLPSGNVMPVWSRHQVMGREAPLGSQVNQSHTQKKDNGTGAGQSGGSAGSTVNTAE